MQQHKETPNRSTGSPFYHPDFKILTVLVIFWSKKRKAIPGLHEILKIPKSLVRIASKDLKKCLFDFSYPETIDDLKTDAGP